MSQSYESMRIRAKVRMKLSDARPLDLINARRTALGPCTGGPSTKPFKTRLVALKELVQLTSKSNSPERKQAGPHEGPTANLRAVGGW